jgi:hypothetical protein
MESSECPPAPGDERSGVETPLKRATASAKKPDAALHQTKNFQVISTD